MPAGIYTGSKKAKYQNRKYKDRVKMLTGGQAKIAAKAPPPNKIDEKDFAVLRAEKAKGRGMGLQDEKVKPGKVQKAALGMLALGIGAKKLMDKNKKELPPGLGAAALLTKKKKEILGKKMGGVMKAKRGKFGEAKDYKKYLKGLKKATSEVKAKAIKSPEYSPSNPKGTKSYRALGIKNEDAFYKEKMKDPKFAKAVYKTKGNKNLPASIDNRMRQLNANNRLDKINKNPKTKKMYEKGITFGTKALKATTVGKIALGVGAAGVAAQQYLKSKMNKKKDVKKKMGGGMMQRPMGYKYGTSVTAKCKLGRNKPTKIT
jgi:hypothetical protein